jgi:hypothetical protein
VVTLAAPAVMHRLDRVATRARQIPVATGYAVVLLLNQVILSVLPPSARLAIDQATSTNIKHLAFDPLFVLPASAFVPSGNGWIWVPLTPLLLGGLERALGVRRALIVAFGAHVIATLLSEGLLLAQITWHTAPPSAVDILDIGPSYLLLAALSGCLVVGRRRVRIAAAVAGAIVVPGLVTGISHVGMSAVGHLSSLVLGALLAIGLNWHEGRPRSHGRWATTARSTALASDVLRLPIALPRLRSRPVAERIGGSRRRRAHRSPARAKLAGAS